MHRMRTDRMARPPSRLIDYQEEIEAACAATSVPSALIIALLSLEKRFQNLHSYGARPNLRREIGELLEEHLSTLSAT